MVTVRRAYVYLVSGISLLAIAFALIILLQGLIPPGPVPTATTLALQIAIVVIALPFFLVHWLWAQRSTRSDPEERSSLVRRLYLYVLLAVFLGAFLVYAFLLVQALLRIGLRVTPFASSTPLENLIDAAIGLLILTPLWLYHHLTTGTDERAAPAADLNASVRRLYILGFSAVGLILTAWAASQLIRWLLYRFGGPAAPGGMGMVDAPIDELARLVAGAPLWVIFWLWVQRLFQGPNEEERASTLRKLYLYLVILISALGAVSTATIILAGILRGLMALPTSGDIRDPLCIAFTLAVVWAYHWRVLQRDAATVAEGLLQAGIRRLYLYLVAAIGLGALLGGLAGDISVLIRTIAGDPFGSTLREPLAWFTAALVAGLPVWLLPWRSAQLTADRPGPQGSDERRSIVRKLYLYFYLFAASMTVLGSA
ncbi:MAG: DUF5671 domain-containing protein, partial [Anaerolineae bacterium]